MDNLLKTKVKDFLNKNATYIQNEEFDMVAKDLTNVDVDVDTAKTVYELFLNQNIDLKDYPLYHIGQNLKIVDSGYVYPTFDTFFDKYKGLDKYKDAFVKNINNGNQIKRLNDRSTVLVLDVKPDPDTMRFGYLRFIYVVGQNGIVYLIGQKGLSE